MNKKTGRAAISWVITDKHESFKCTGDSGCPKFHNALDSYGSEAFGIVVLLNMIKIVCDYYNIKTGKIIIACDNDSSLDKCVITSYRAKVSDKYFDLLWAAHDLRKAVSIKISPKHVTGHQDGKKRKLNLYERLNVECDTRSKFLELESKMEISYMNRYNLDMNIGVLHLDNFE